MELGAAALLSSGAMDVFVIPVGRERYELYCEQPADPDEVDSLPPRGIVANVRHRFKTFLRAAEERQRQGATEEHTTKGWFGRLHDHVMAWVAERVEEQRLLWNLRGHSAAVAAHPQDMTSEQVLALVRRLLQHDHDRHRKWMVIDGILFLLTFVALGPLFLLVPGVANLPALYFGFRAVGHFLSMRGAAHGLRGAQWSSRPCPPLGELRDIGVLEAPDRSERLHDISCRLRLQRLSTFFERVTIHA
jgi:hypothetical protein